MNEKEEKIYIQGNRAAWSKILSDSLQQLGYDDPAVTQKHRWILEREAVIAQLRDLCAEFGDNSWDEKLHLADVIEKHLGKHLYSEKNAAGEFRR
ncbi:hypothetical protein KA005_35855 [bacterium]|nr:hypothetical protein [bacterium]